MAAITRATSGPFWTTHCSMAIVTLLASNAANKMGSRNREFAVRLGQSSAFSGHE
jgi:hypothetical protein